MAHLIFVVESRLEMEIIQVNLDILRFPIKRLYSIKPSYSMEPNYIPKNYTLRQLIFELAYRKSIIT